MKKMLLGKWNDIMKLTKEENCHYRKSSQLVICRINMRIPFTSEKLNNVLKKRQKTINIIIEKEHNIAYW